ncbi:DUF748 domain-containing protein [Alteromonas sp. 1_MG-2023]|uniref:DUF748 domain-containing protein n=1 Tax=Alteromonas sp. 1_MG-2023 TaxID=3062669 RepID=UPI0026E337F8|nr:DUF748 domain-containing protein [Alteromonas sp. 1_MG-2023]MDO6474497.1 DUF748 domain-containing protein [Alteromonas sp. 1_MG-2023]
MHSKNRISSFSRKPLWLRLSVYFLLIYITYVLLAGVVLPAVLKATVPDKLTDMLGREVTVKDISVNPFLLRAEVSDFSIKEAERDENFFALQALTVDLGFWQTLTSFTPTVENIALRAPYVQLHRLTGGENTRLNVSDIIDTLAKNAQQEEPETAPEEQAGIPHIRLNHFTLQNGHILLSDAVTGARLDYPELDITLTGLDTLATITKQRGKSANSPEAESSETDNSETDNAYDFQLNTAEGGKVSLKGDFQLSPLVFNSDIRLSDIALAPLWPLSNDIIDVELTDGRVDLALAFSLFEENASLNVTVKDGSFGLHSLTLARQDEPKITVPELAVDGIEASLADKSVNVDKIAVADMLVNAVFDDDGLDLQRYLLPDTAPLTGSTPQASSTLAGEEESGWHVVLNAFEFTGGAVALTEKAIADNMFWRVFNINLTTGPVDSQFTSPVHYNLALSTSGNAEGFAAEDTGTLRSEGDIDIAAQQVKGALTLEDFLLSPLQQYISPYANVIMESGRLSTQSSFTADASGTADINASVSLADLAILDTQKKAPLLKWQALDIANLAFSTTANTLSIDNVMLREPFAKLVIDENKHTNISDIIVSRPPATGDSGAASEQAAKVEGAENEEGDTPEKTADEKSQLAITVNQISIENGNAYFADNSLTPRFASGIESLNGTVSQLDSASGIAAAVDIGGKIDNYAPVSLKGSIDPFSDALNLDLMFSVSGAELTSVNPYSGTYMGYYIDKGLLSLDVQYKLQGDALEGDNHVVIDQLTLGQKSDSEQALSLPLGLAVALLQDRNGVIDLGLEVSGDVDSPDFSFGSIILNAIGNLITKAVTAPFSFLASLVGSDDTLNEVTFAAGSSELDDEATATLTTLAKALKKRPGLRLNIEGTVNAVTDAGVLAEKTLQDRLLTLSGDGALPANLTASSYPVEGPLSDALKQAFTETLGITVEEERAKIIAQLTPSTNENGASEQTEQTPPEVDETWVQRALHIAMYNSLRSNIDISPGQLAALADRRAKAVKRYLINDAAIDANRLFQLNSRHHLQEDVSGATLTLEAD